MEESSKYIKKAMDFKRTFSTSSASLYPTLSSKADTRATVVIEIGKRLTKVGLAGDFVPRDISSSKYFDALSMKTYEIFNKNYTDEEQHFVLVNFFKEIIFKRLIMTINERRVVIVESVLTPTRTRKAIAKALFECPSLAPHSVLFAPSHLLCTFPFNAKNCLILDIGTQESILFPVAEGCLMLSQYESTPLCALSVEDNLRNLLLKHARIRTALTEKFVSLGESPFRSLQNEDLNFLDQHGVIEDIVVRFCFATTIERGRKLQRHVKDNTQEIETPPPDIELPFGTDILILPGFVREAAAEILFTYSASYDNRSLPQIILDAILNVPIDLRRMFLSKLLIVGGIARMTGFLSRLKAELLALINDEVETYARLSGLKEIAFFRFEEDISLELYCAWLGGSMFGYCDVAEGRAITREEWLAQETTNKRIPDWTNKIDDYFKANAKKK